jgi:hypothetical protein
MNKRMNVVSIALLLIMFALNASGCSKLYGPSDEEIIKAINDTGLFSGGVEKFTLTAPIVILDKGLFSSEGAWPVKVKMIYTYTMTSGHETKPTEKIQSFRIIKSKDSSGNPVWIAIAGPQ